MRNLMILVFAVLITISCNEDKEVAPLELEFSLDKSEYYNRDTVRFINENFDEFEEVFVSYSVDGADGTLTSALMKDDKGYYIALDPDPRPLAYTRLDIGTYPLVVSTSSSSLTRTLNIVYPQLTLASNDTILYYSKRFKSGADTVITYTGERLLNHKWTLTSLIMENCSSAEFIEITNSEIKMGVLPFQANEKIYPLIGFENRISIDGVYVQPVAKLTTPVVDQEGQFRIEIPRSGPWLHKLYLDGEEVPDGTPDFRSSVTALVFGAFRYAPDVYELELELFYDDIPVRMSWVGSNQLTIN